MLRIPESFVQQEKQFNSDSYIKIYESKQAVTKSKIQLTSFLISFILEGTKQINDLGQSVVINTSQFVLLKPSHCLMTEKLSNHQAYKSLLCFFSPTTLSKILVKHQLQKSDQVSTNSFFVMTFDQYIQHFIQSILLLKQSNNPANDFLFSLKIEELILYLVHQYGTSIIDFLLSAQYSETDLNFERVIEKNIDAKLTIEELAFLCQMSTSTFKRKFKQRHGASPAKWFQQKRLQKAKQLLLNNNTLPSQIYAEVGFENFSSFSQAFKKEFGQSPKQYQKRAINID